MELYLIYVSVETSIDLINVNGCKEIAAKICESLKSMYCFKNNNGFTPENILFCTTYIIKPLMLTGVLTKKKLWKL